MVERRCRLNCFSFAQPMRGLNLRSVRHLLPQDPQMVRFEVPESFDQLNTLSTNLLRYDLPRTTRLSRTRKNNALTIHISGCRDLQLNQIHPTRVMMRLVGIAEAKLVEDFFPANAASHIQQRQFILHLNSYIAGKTPARYRSLRSYDGYEHHIATLATAHHRSYPKKKQIVQPEDRPVRPSRLSSNRMIRTSISDAARDED